MQCVCVCTCACAECRGVYKKCYFDILIHKRQQPVEIIEFLIETGSCVFREKWYMARAKVIRSKTDAELSGWKQ